MNDLLQAQLMVPSDKECYIIGGAELYTQCLPYVNEMIITRIDGVFEGDIYFPQFSEDEWEVTERTVYSASERDFYPFTIEHWRRIR